MKKLIRDRIVNNLNFEDWEIIVDKAELNKLYGLKVLEELGEIQDSEHKDIKEFADLIQVTFNFAKQNGYTYKDIAMALFEKAVEKGSFSNIALKNLNPDNPSNKLYLDIDHTSVKSIAL